jgi:hypothetical protein
MRCSLTYSTYDSMLACALKYAPDASAGSPIAVNAIPRPLPTEPGGVCGAECGSGADWTCVGHVTFARPQAGTFTYDITVRLLATGAFVSEVKVEICDAIDAACNPVASGTTDPNGRVSLTFNNSSRTGSGLGNYYYIKATSLDAASPVIAPTLAYITTPLVQSGAPLTLEVFSPGLPLVQNDLMMQQDPNLGVMLAFADDCRWDTAPGVQISAAGVDAGAYYGFGTTSGATATATDNSGDAIFMNVPPGPIELTAKPLALGGTTSSRVNVGVRAGYVTLVALAPTP